MKDGENRSFDTMVEALENLSSRGYSGNLKLRSNHLQATEMELLLYPGNFKVVEAYRFEGDSNPDDNSVVYAIESLDGSYKGVLVNAYGAYTDTTSSEIIRHLEIDKRH